MNERYVMKRNPVYESVKLFGPALYDISILDELAKASPPTLGTIGPVIDEPGVRIKPAKEGDDDACDFKH